MIKAPGGQNGSRIAQACDRCRSKKIKCDGKRPSCSQCSSVGFECKITDKLTRRAFPRGYTESLEDRVRQLESENQKLLDLLDLKDEQMDLMSRVHYTQNQKYPNNSTSESDVKNETKNIYEINNNNERDDVNIKLEDDDNNSIDSASNSNSNVIDEDEDTYLVKHTNTLCLDDTFKGSSTGAIFVEALIEKLNIKAPGAVLPIQNAFFQNRNSYEKNNIMMNSPSNNGMHTYGKKNHAYSLPNLFPVSPPASISSPNSDKTGGPGVQQTKSPVPNGTPNNGQQNFSCINLCSRVLCDKLITDYFQEWHSVFSIVNYDQFISQYQNFMDNEAFVGDFSENPIFAIQLLLILQLAGLGSKDQSLQQELHPLDDWKWLFNFNLQTKPGLDTLQALCLALLYSLHVGNTTDTWHFRAMAVNMAYRLGLHRPYSTLRHYDGSQLSNVESQDRTKLFWMVYILDAASSVAVGSPRLCHDSCISTPLPSVSEEEGDGNTGVTPFHLRVISFSKILAGIIDTIYSFNESKDYYSYKTVIKFEDQLESWKRELEPEFKFEFANGAPTSSCSLKPVHQKSPLLLMLYHWARILIHMPAVSPVISDSTSTKGSGATVAIVQSAKVFTQVFNYLNTRKVVSTLFFNPSSVLLHLNSIILYSAVDYSRSGALLQEAKSMIGNSLDYLHGQIQAERSGCLPIVTYQWFEQACDVVLRTSKDSIGTNNNSSSSSNIAATNTNTSQKKTRRGSTKKQQGQKAQLTPPETTAVPITTTSLTGHQNYIPSTTTADSDPYYAHKSMTIPHADVDEMLKTMGFDSAVMNDGHHHNNNRKFSEPAISCIPSQTTLSTVNDSIPSIATSAASHNNTDNNNHNIVNTNVEDYLDFWNSMDYLNLCKDNFAV